MKQSVHLTETELKSLIKEAMSEYSSFRISGENDKYRQILIGLVENGDVDPKEIALMLIDDMNEENIKDFMLSFDCFNKFLNANDESTNYDTDDGRYDTYADDTMYESVSRALKKVLKESLYTEEEGEAIDFDTMQDILHQFGISTIDSREVENPQTGETGTRYGLDAKDIDKEALENALKSAANNPEGIILSLGQHRYAPEIKRWSVIVLNY